MEMLDSGVAVPGAVHAAATSTGGGTEPIVGTVNDGNAFHAFGGVAGHAGLFSTLDDLLALGRSARAGRRGRRPDRPGGGARVLRGRVPTRGSRSASAATRSTSTRRAPRCSATPGSSVAASGSCPGSGVAVAMASNRLVTAGEPATTERPVGRASSRRRQGASRRDACSRVDGLSVSFRTRRDEVAAVRDVSFHVDAGETLAIVGESGSGKTTTAAAINRLLPGNGRIVAGSIWFGERDLTRLGESQLRAIRGAAIGLVPQDPMSNLDPVMRVGDQIAEALEVHGVATGRAARTRVIELLDLVGIPDAERRAAQYPHEFSGGMRQRVLIAIGLSCRPQLLIADEPTSALDVTVQRRILDRLDELTDEMGTSVVLITHDLGLARRARRPGGGDAPGRDRRDRRGRGDPHRAAARVHPGAARGLRRA